MLACCSICILLSLYDLQRIMSRTLTINLCPPFSVEAQLGGFVLLDCLVATVTIQKLDAEAVYANQIRAN